MGQQFQPIAIVGSGCIVPGCATAAELWETVAAGRSQLTHATADDWRIRMEEVLGGEPGRPEADRTWSEVGGYVRNFDPRFEQVAMALAPDLVARLDPVFRWSLHAAGQALAGLSPATPRGGRAGVILGNLSYPTRAFTLLTEQEWFRRLVGESLLPDQDVHAWNRFMSGLPAMVVGQAYGLAGGSLALDAACASGLYAIKLACDRLQDGRADLMLAGAVNAADQLFLHVGFCALNALSRSGRSRPFHAEADGLIPAEGAAFIALKRLDDALAAGDRILGVIRGVGLSNDGRSGGFLQPSQAGQARAMRNALAQAGLSPDEIQYVECHATGTPVGDATEIASLAEVYGRRDDLALGSLKANLGHLITASGVAGLIKVLGAMAHETIPPTPGSRPLTSALSGSGFQVPEAAIPWPERGGQRTAAVSSFGFGGNNAHLIVQQYAPATAGWPAVASLSGESEFAVVGLGIRTHLDRDSRAFAARLLGEGGTEEQGDLDSITLPIRQLAFPPADLKEVLGQQLVLLDLVREATRQVSGMTAERTGIYVGMQIDSETSRYSLRWRWPELLRQAGIAVDGERLDGLREAVSPPLSSAGAIGTMPNVCANRLNNQLNIQGPGFAVSREELSGDAALDLACTAIRRGEIDVALVAAVDLCREEVHQRVAREVLCAAGDRAADAAVMLIIKSRARAEKDGDPILAILAPGDASVAPTLSNDPAGSPIQAALGHAHAASGLLHVALAVQMLESGRRIAADGTVQPLLPSDGYRQVAIGNRSFTGETAHWLLREACPARENRLPSPAIPLLRTYAASDAVSLAERIRQDQPGGDGPCRLAIVAEPEQLDGLRAKARQFLAADGMGDSWSLEGISFRRRPLQGELAFAFTGAAAAYPAMGRDLLLGMPRLTQGLAQRLRNLDAAGGWVYENGDQRARLPFYQLAGSSFLCQLHTEFSRRVLGLRPTVSLGLSSGETNGMFAFGVWQDFDALFSDTEKSGLYSSALANTFDAVRDHWGLPPGTVIDWENYRLRASVDAVRAALAGIGRVYLTIVNSPTDCVVGGDRAACEKLLAALGNPPAVPLGHDLAIHCEVVMPFEPAWRCLHTRTTTPVDGVRFYSNYFGGQFTPTQDTVADALTGQALQTIDFPKIVNLAWEDGVRIFVEHGPRNGLSTAIGEILGDREHLAVPLDRPGVSALVQAYRAAAQLWCAGVEVDLAGLEAAAPSVSRAVEPTEDAGPSIAFRLRPPTPAVSRAMVPKLASLPAESPADVYVPPLLRAGAPGGRLLPSAPALAVLLPTSPRVSSRELADSSSAKPVSHSLPALTSTQAHESGVLGLLLAGHRQLAEAHNAYLQAQGQAMQAFTESMARIQAAMLGNPLAVPFSPAAVPSPLPATPFPIPSPSEVAMAPILQPPAVAPLKANRSYPGPAFSREDLEILAGGEISSIFGEAFKSQDHYPVQVRMPQPPLLLCDRVLGIEGEHHSMGQGAIWTETDVRADSWYLHHGHMPAGVFLESGQADLLLISWLGIDEFNQGERAYRLLGCDLMFHGDLPVPGDTLHYEIRADGHAQHGDVRLFFFHYDCYIGGELRLSVRNGQAGFFTREELHNSAGVIWSPQTAAYTPDVAVSPAPLPSRKRRFSAAEVESYLAGDLAACFGEEFSRADSHARTPCSPGGWRNFLGQVAEFDLAGGPAGRGYLRVETAVRGDEWFFDGHFKNDPCMPGTLMAEACLQAMAFYMAASGRTLHRDGWRFRPMAGVSYRFKCRGQATPESRQIVYELFVDEIVDGPLPVLYAHALVTVDGRKAFLCERMGLQMVPDQPPAHPSAPVPSNHAGQTLTQPWRVDLDSPEDAWLRDHCPTYTLPSLPLTFELEMMAAAATQVFPAYRLQTIERADAKHWIACPDSVAEGLVLVQPGEGGQADIVLQSKAKDGRLITAATARLHFGPSWPAAILEPLEPLLDPAPIEKPYDACALFHGPALQLMRKLVRGRNGARALLAPAGAALPSGLLNPGLLDAALHCIPHYDFRFWCPEVGPGMVAYPIRIENFRQFGSLLGDGEWSIDARFVRLESNRFPRTHLRIQQGEQVLAAFDLLEILLPMGRLGRVPPMDLRAFMRDRRFVPGVALSDQVQGETTLRRQDVLSSEWLPGTLAQVYGAKAEGDELARQIALREHGARELRLHPSQVCFDADGRCLNLPFNAWDVSCSEGADVLVVHSRPPAALDWETIHRDWSARMTGDAAFVRDLGVALVRAFVRRVVLADPLGYAALKGRPFLYLGNHQSGVESLLFLSIATSLTQVPTGAIAKHEHRQSWLGRIHHLTELAMGSSNPLRMLFFDRAKQTDMLRILKEFGGNLDKDPYSLLVHVDGTRSLVAGAPVRGVSSVLIDLALTYDLPIVPVRFAGGVRMGSNDERQEFPYALGQQDYYLGAAIQPEVLRALPYAERARFVAESINRLGPTQDADVPLPGLPGLAEAVAAAEAAGRNSIQAVLYAALRGFPGLNTLTRSLLDEPAGGQGGDLAKQGLDLIGGGG